MQRGLTEGLANTFVWMEEIIAAHLDMLFPGLTVVAAYPFRVTRDVDLEIKDDEASDLLTDMEEELGMRQFGSIRLEVDQTMPDTVREVLTGNLNLAPSLVYVDSPLGMADLMELTHIARPDLKDAPFHSAVPHVLMKKTEDVFAVLRRQDVLLYHPTTVSCQWWTSWVPRPETRRS